MSGSSGNAIYIETSGSKILIDAGQAGKRFAWALEESCGVNPGALDGIITHAHRNHICGAGILSRRYNLPIYANLALETVKNILEKAQVCLKDVDISVAPRYQPGRCVSI